MQRCSVESGKFSPNPRSARGARSIKAHFADKCALQTGLNARLSSLDRNAKIFYFFYL
jgi:hypothetical protein